ncbi:hypothetical protein [Micromonospora globbae]|uniref:hypothetical protein n=1 Tax=Micromonospora globbae TaxID=1894969 RepID=UPI00386BEECB|nr:hypothetical protein OH732_26470 [Micromonospora globbae]
MLLDPDAEDAVAYELCQLVGRAILPYRRTDQPDPGEPGGDGTAFFFQDASGEYLLTADAVTGGTGDLGLRASVTEPVGVAPATLGVGSWTRRPEIGVAILPASDLHRQAGEGGWAWRVQPVIDVIAADAAVVERVGAAPASAFVLAHGVREDGDRPLEVAVERVVRADGVVRVAAELPPGYVGAPVFSVEADDDGGMRLHCLGLLLPGSDGHPVATFDRIRAALPDAA